MSHFSYLWKWTLKIPKSRNRLYYRSQKYWDTCPTASAISKIQHKVGPANKVVLAVTLLSFKVVGDLSLQINIKIFILPHNHTYLQWKLMPFILYFSLMLFPIIWVSYSVYTIKNILINHFIFTLQMPSTTKTGPDWRQEPGSPSESPRWLSRTWVHEPESVASQSAY